MKFSCQALIKIYIAKHLLNVFIFEYNIYKEINFCHYNLTLVVLKRVENIQISVALECARIKCLIYSYAPVLRAIIEGDTKQTGFFFIKTEYTPPIVDNGDPTFLLFITDGENSDCNATDAIIRKASSMNVFIQFIGIGNEQFNYLRKLDDLSGRLRDNTGFSKMQSLDNASDQELYTNVLDQFSKWLKGLQ